jgi:hypothetical protein
VNELEAISIDESKRFIALEVIIEKGKKTFIEVGEALLEIRDSRLYRLAHPTFEDYCVKKWSFTRMHASRLIAGAEVCNQLVTAGAQALPETESQARPLAQLPTPEKKAEAFTKAVQASPTGKPTAKEITKAVQEVKGKTSNPKKANKKKPAKTKVPAKKKEEDNSIGEDSKALSQLKYWWENATFEEQASFREWEKKGQGFLFHLRK